MKHQIDYNELKKQILQMGIVNKLDEILGFTEIAN
jgi:hypothetical protein